MRILAVDPGYERMGVAILDGAARGGKETLVHSSCITTPSTSIFEKRLAALGGALEELVKTYRPNAVAVESLYFYTNQKTALLVAETRGVVRYLSALHNLPVFEYTPLQIKVAVTGNGHGDKQQVATMVEQLLSLGKGKKKRLDDEYDAIAIGLTCLASERH